MLISSVACLPYALSLKQPPRALPLSPPITFPVVFALSLPSLARFPFRRLRALPSVAFALSPPSPSRSPSRRLRVLPPLAIALMFLPPLAIALTFLLSPPIPSFASSPLPSVVRHLSPIPTFASSHPNEFLLSPPIPSNSSSPLPSCRIPPLPSHPIEFLLSPPIPSNSSSHLPFRRSPPLPSHPLIPPLSLFFMSLLYSPLPSAVYYLVQLIFSPRSSTPNSLTSFSPKTKKTSFLAALLSTLAYDADDDEDAPEEAQPATPAPRRGRATAASGTKTAAKGGEPPRGAAKTRNLHPVRRSVWSPRESTIFVAARGFMKDELGALLGKQGSQYWARLVRHLEQENPGPHHSRDSFDGAELLCHLVEVVTGREVDPLLLEGGREMHEERVYKHVAQGLGQPEDG
ncbi:unnamed protein product [Closterium sp. Naga37s-1]|nr:unnamed protein product [Closterium sp. Naga37s-1]